MVLIMTMTPLHMTEHGHDLAAVGLVISGHTFGMFALSPVSGRLTDRFGSLAGRSYAGLASWRLRRSCRPPRRPRAAPLLFIALFLLGYGWNLGFVAGSALLTQRPVARRADPRPGPHRRADLELGRGAPASARGARGRGRATRRSGCSARPSSASRRGVLTMRRGASSRRRPGRLSRPAAPISRTTQAARTRAHVLDLVERHVLVGAVGDLDVARPEDHARRRRRR